MSEQDNRPLDGTSPTPEENLESEIEINLDEETIEDDSQDETVEELKAKLAKKDETIRQVLARAKKAEAEKKQNFNKTEPKKGKDDIRQTVQELQLAEQKRQFGYTNKLSPEETDYLFKINANPSSELLNDPFIKGGLEAIRKSKRVEENTPAFGSRSQRFELPKKENLTPQDKQEQFDAYKKNRFGK